MPSILAIDGTKAFLHNLWGEGGSNLRPQEASGWKRRLPGPSRELGGGGGRREDDTCAARVDPPPGGGDQDLYGVGREEPLSTLFPMSKTRRIQGVDPIFLVLREFGTLSIHAWGAPTLEEGPGRGADGGELEGCRGPGHRVHWGQGLLYFRAQRAVFCFHDCFHDRCINGESTDLVTFNDQSTGVLSLRVKSRRTRIRIGIG